MGQLRDDAIGVTAARKKTIISWIDFGINETVMSHLHIHHSALANCGSSEGENWMKPRPVNNHAPTIFCCFFALFFLLI